MIYVRTYTERTIPELRSPSAYLPGLRGWYCPFSFGPHSGYTAGQLSAGSATMDTQGPHLKEEYLKYIYSTVCGRTACPELLAWSSPGIADIGGA